MKRLHLAAAALACAAATTLGLPLHAQTNAYTPVVATHVKYAGADIATGVVTVTMLDSTNGAAASFVTADGTLNGPQAFSGVITNGAVTGLNAPDMCTAVNTVANHPLSALVQVTRQIDSTHTSGYSFTIPAGSTVMCGSGNFALDQYRPAQTTPIAPTGLVAVATVPTRCGSPSLTYLTVSPNTLYLGVAGTCVPLTGGPGTSVTLKTNGTNNGSQTALNLKQGTGITLADDGSGGITITSTASGAALPSGSGLVKVAGGTSSLATAGTHHPTPGNLPPAVGASATTLQGNIDALAAAALIPDTTFSALPTPTALLLGHKYVVTDGTAGTACTAGGGGTARVICEVYQVSAGVYGYRAVGIPAGEKGIANGVVQQGSTPVGFAAAITGSNAALRNPVRYHYVQEGGDSYGRGTGSTAPGTLGAFALFNADTNLPVNQFSHPGASMAAQALDMANNFIYDPNAPSLFLTNGGQNDGSLDTCGGTAGTNCIGNFDFALNYELSATIPYSNRQNASLATLSNFSTNNAYALKVQGFTQGLPASPTASGGTATFSAPGTATRIGLKYVLWTGNTSSTAGFTFACDGTPLTDASTGTTTFSTGGYGNTAYLATYGPVRQEFVVTATGATPHSCVVTATNYAAGQIIVEGIDWNTPGATPAAANPVLYVAGNPAFNYYTVYNAAAVSRINTYAANWPVAYVDSVGGITVNGVTYPGINGTTDVGAADANCAGTTASNHLRDCAHRKLYNLLEAAEQVNGFIAAVPGLGVPRMQYLTPTVGDAIASASIISPTMGITPITGTTPIATITVPLGANWFIGSQITLVPASNVALTSGGNIQANSQGTMIANNAYTLTWNGSKWSAPNIGVTSSQGVIGPAAAPTGTCPTAGLVVISQDGHITRCPSVGGTWATII